jgi:integrase
MPTHELIGGKIQVYRRKNSRFWQCSASVGGKQRKSSTKQDSLALAKQVAEDWYLELRGKARAGLLPKGGKTFNQAADKFEEEYEVITEGDRSPKWVEGHKIRLRVHLRPFFGKMALADITAGKVQEYRVHRINTRMQPNPHSRSNRPLKDKKPARNTLDNEIISLRQVLKTGLRHGWIETLPDLSPPYKTRGKKEHRPWFSPEEYTVLRHATAEHARKATRAHDRWNAEQLHDYVLFMANTGLRPDEAGNLEHRDIEMVKDAATGELILEIDVRGKTGVGTCKSMPGAVKPYQRLLNRPKWQPVGRKPRSKKALEAWEATPAPATKMPQPTDKVFPGSHTKLFNKILADTGLKLDRDNQPRVAYSLRHFYICMRLMEGADVYSVARNCRTSVEMIQKHYATHIKNFIDAAAINVRRPRKRPTRDEIRSE